MLEDVPGGGGGGGGGPGGGRGFGGGNGGGGGGGGGRVFPVDVVHEDGVRLLRGLPAQNLMDGSSNVTRDLVADRLNILFNPNDRLGCRQNMVSCCIRAFYTPHPARNSDQYSIRYQLYGAVVTQ